MVRAGAATCPGFSRPSPRLPRPAGPLQVQKGVWNEVVLRVRLNTPGRADGVAGLGVNGQYREYDKMVWRLDGATALTTVLLVTFFGGSWSTPVDTAIDFANFNLTVLE